MLHCIGHPWNSYWRTLPPPVHSNPTFSARPCGAEKPKVSKGSGADLWTAAAQKCGRGVLSPGFSPKLWTDPVQYGFRNAFGSKDLGLAGAHEVRNDRRV